jgi:hypothetical protein
MDITRRFDNRWTGVGGRDRLVRRMESRPGDGAAGPPRDDPGHSAALDAQRARGAADSHRPDVDPVAGRRLPGPGLVDGFLVAPSRPAMPLLWQGDDS